MSDLPDFGSEPAGNVPDPAPRPQRHDRPGRIGRFSLGKLLYWMLCCVLLLAVYRYLFSQRWEEQARLIHQQKLADQLVQTLPQLPRQIDAWIGTDLPQDLTPFPQAGLDGWLLRTYRHSDHGGEALVCVSVGKLKSVKSGPQCVANRMGHDLLPANAPREDAVAVGGARRVPTYGYYALGRAGQEQFSKSFLRWSQWINGRWQLPRDAGLSRHPSDTVVQVSLYFPLSSSPQNDYNGSEQPGVPNTDRDFSPRLFRALDQLLPTDAVTDTDTLSGSG